MSSRKAVAISCVECPRKATADLVYVADLDGGGMTVQSVPGGWACVRGSFGRGSNPDNQSKWHRATTAWLCPGCFGRHRSQAHPERATEYTELLAAATDHFGVTWCKQAGCGNVADVPGILHGAVACGPCIAREFEVSEEADLEEEGE